MTKAGKLLLGSFTALPRLPSSIRHNDDWLSGSRDEIPRQGHVDGGLPMISNRVATSSCTRTASWRVFDVSAMNTVTRLIRGQIVILDRSSKIFGILFVISVFLPQFAVMAVGLHLTFEFSKAGLFAFAFLVFNAAALIQILAQPILAIRLAYSAKPAKPAYIGCNRILIGASAVTCLLAVRASPETSLTLYMITAALGAVDQIFTGSYPLVAQRSYGVDYARTASLANLMGRGSAAVAPAIAGLGIANASAQMVVLLSLFLLGLPCVNAPYETQSRAAKQEQVHSKGRGIVAYLRALPPWSKWFMVFTIGANLAFSSVAFVILSDARTSQSLAPPAEVVNAAP
ncbi:hypothetical protein [Phyllobacterium lublinensis]|uniref:hypothetical protein n=1 Tax=Phyllobacterium lublinensis TaxID=2875708 RepID=UPI001CCE040B|nr:hypothetical protein [Phyllobacterium sp. 2063]MBZ9657266.1 hypothetical protein [Phyllobacterium sp. 2063]